MSKSSANWLKRIMSNRVLHILGEKTFLFWQNIVLRFVLAHSNRPWSRDTLKVTSVGSVGTPILLRKFKKLASQGD